MSLNVFESFLNFAEIASRCKSELPVGIDTAEFENALVNYGVILLHAHMEQCMRKGIDMRCSRCADPEVRTFALSVRKEKTGKIGIKYLKATLKRFSDSYKRDFGQYLKQSGLGESWDSIVNQRHIVAHEGQPATLTLADLRLYYEHVRKVLGFFCIGLGLTPPEVRIISTLIEVPASPPA